MEPVRWGRDDALTGGELERAGAAAMEPVRWGRDDDGPAGHIGRAGPPQWSPSAGDGTTESTLRHHITAAEPQWSPSAGDGTTELLDDALLHRSLAAMEPVRWGRDDGAQCNDRHRRFPGRNGARPLGTGRLIERDIPFVSMCAAMEPVRWGRDDTEVNTLLASKLAPQWSPSAGDGTTTPRRHALVARLLPQWSPSAGDGTTSPPGLPLGTRSPAAMEPVRWGRDDPSLRGPSTG
mgnify:CR=1 FL=1